MSTNGSLSSGDLPNRGPTVLAVTTATLVFASLFFLARITCRVFIVRKVGWDDWFMVLAWVGSYNAPSYCSFGFENALANSIITTVSCLCVIFLSRLWCYQGTRKNRCEYQR